eukprot:SAG22_NODE_12065_length_457_cov_1.296089_1_plen_136_part_01
MSDSGAAQPAAAAAAAAAADADADADADAADAADAGPPICELAFTKNDHQLLVLIAQQLSKGSNSGFTDFLRSPAAGVSKQMRRRHDPKVHDWAVLAGFIGSLTDARQLQMVQQIYQWDRQNKVVAANPDGRLKNS